MELVRHGDLRDTPADAVGLGLFGPGKFVDRQHDLIAQIPDRPDDALVGQREGVEGAREEGDGPGLLKAEAAVEDLLFRDKAVEPPQHGSTVIEGQFAALVLPDKGQYLLQRQQERPALFMPAQRIRSEHPAAQDIEGLLPHLAAEARQPLEQHPQQPLPALAVYLVLLREPGPVGVVLLIHNAHRVQHRGHHAAVGGAQVASQVPQDLLQLGGGQPQAEPAQIVRDVLGELLLADLQPPAQLHRDLVALLGGKHGGDLQQGASRLMADRHPVADLHQVAQVGGDMQQVPSAAPGVVGEQADVDLLDDPGRGAFQVVQEDL